MNIFQDDQPPIGFTMGLALDLEAMNRYSALSEAQKEELLNRARDAKSKREMKRIIDSIH